MFSSILLKFTEMDNNNNSLQAFWVSLGSLFSFGFALVSSIILVRYFTKDDYGTYRQVLYVYSTFLVVFTLGLPSAFSYFLPRVNINEARHLIKKISAIFLLMGTLFSLLLFIFAPFIANELKNPDLESALRLFSPVPMLLLPTMGIDGVLATYHRTNLSALYTILAKAILFICIILPVVAFNGSLRDAIIGYDIASFIGLVLCIYLIFKPVRKYGNSKSSVTYKQIFSFSMPLLYSGLWGIVISSTDQFFISRYFGTQVFAEFSNGSLQLPFVAMIISAASTVLAPLFSKMVHENANPAGEILPIWRTVFERSVKIIYPLVIFFFFYADTLMVLLYGQQYEASGTFFKIKLIVNLFTMIAYNPLILAIGATRYYAKVHMYGAIILILCEYLSVIIFQSPQVVTAVSVICQIGRIFALLLFISQAFKVKIFELFPLRIIQKIFFPAVVILFVVRYLFNNILHFAPITEIIAGFTLYAVIFLVWIIIAKIDYMCIIEPILLKIRNR